MKCKDQAEGSTSPEQIHRRRRRGDNCDCLEDKCGVSWQIIPDALGRRLGDPDCEKANRVMQAMFKVKNIVVADRDRAAAA